METSNKQPKVTLESLSVAVDKLAETVTKGFAQTATSIEELAIMTANGFAQTASKNDLEEVEIRLGSRIDKLESKVDAIANVTLPSMKKRITALEQSR